MSRMVVIGQWARYALLAIIGIAVVAWLVSLPFRGEPDAAPAAEPTIEPAAATPSPTPTADPYRRFLALDAGGVLWRGTAGSCVAGIGPTLERTTDAVTWRPATPADAAELLALVPGDAADQATVAIALTDGSCTVAGRQTNADGTAWEEAVEAPEAPEVPEGALAVTDDGYVARAADDCEGIAFAALDGTWQTCGPGMDPAQPIAIDVADGTLYIWTADVVTSLPVS
ncbi:hypothetical protein E4U02_10295 [Microbacterium paludicola]|uniref:Exo-alpha-sialidase n=1 Tax=Microbacterium paludicola TaxID=300019 RepID=A0A4Y9FU11_9MICO|nr:hypothetical protein [Microbacterium paludicola]MBF0816802.1 hypothetical protein [Microbacterium paludicola]TFU32484.1 hypothetical protein E4U02_10295 [Microbacterium paludicola]